jgi:signal peptidase I
MKTLFWIFWFILLPLGLALLVVGVLSSMSGTDSGLLLRFVVEQSVPATIVFFTLFDMAIYSSRHHLPFAHHVGPSSHKDLSAEQRREIESAYHLIEEAERICRKNSRAISERLSQAQEQELKRSLNALRQEAEGSGFDELAFHEAFSNASSAVDTLLGGWRKSEAREYIESIGIAILVALMLRAVVVEAFKIPSGSMIPTLQVGDHIFVNKFTYGPTLPIFNNRVLEDMPPKRGDVIVFEFPEPNPSRERQDYIKRVIALPGDTLEADGGHPVINGWRVPSCKVGDYKFSEEPGSFMHSGELYVEYLEGTAYLAIYMHEGLDAHEGPFHVSPGELWVMGDNRHNSQDSRKWQNGRGAGVPFANIKGRAMFVWLPPARMFVGVMGTPEPPPGSGPDIKRGLAECLAKRPSYEETVPPAPH